MSNFEILKHSDWFEEDPMRYRIVLGREFTFEGWRYCTWQEAHEYMGKYAVDYIQNLFHGHYMMSYKEALKDFHGRCAELAEFCGKLKNPYEK